MKRLQTTHRNKMIWKIAVIGLLTIASILGASQISLVRRFISRASGSPANLVIDVSGPTKPLTHPWQNLAQGGESAAFTLRPLTPELKQLAPDYIRLDHLYDFYIHITRNEAGNLQYDFSKLDTMISDMRSINTLPFLSLSYTPTVLSSDITGIPNNWNEYQQIIQKTIEHVSGKSALNLKDVYYEVWNEPDLFGEWKTYGAKNYLKLYTAAALGAKTAQDTQPFHFGGPAITRLYDNWINQLMKLVISQNLRLDFISWHHYTNDPEDYRKDVERLRKILEPYRPRAESIEPIISEWGPYSDNDPQYDSMGSAAHLISSLTYMMPAISKAFIFEIEDGKNPEGKEFWGRWGLYTHSEFRNTPKPRAQAIKLLNQLGPDKLVVSGNGTWVRALSAKKGETIQVLLTNYDGKGSHTEQAPLTITHLNPGKYQLTKTYLSRPKLTKTITLTSDTYTTTISLPPHTVVMIELSPLP